MCTEILIIFQSLGAFVKKLISTDNMFGSLRQGVVEKVHNEMRGRRLKKAEAVSLPMEKTP